MASRIHEILVRLFQDCPDLARELLRECAGIEIAGVGETRPNDLTLLEPIQYRADAVFVFRETDAVEPNPAEHVGHRDDAADDAADDADVDDADTDEAVERAGSACAVIVEIQQHVDSDKRWTWPLYVASLRARERCPVILLVMAPTAAVARWADRPIETGHPGFSLRPIVISNDDVPIVRDPMVARRLPQLAVLSALATRDRSVGWLATDRIRTLPMEPWGVYLDELLEVVPGLRELMEVHVEEKYRSDFARKYYSAGLEKGREEGREEGLHDAVVALARAKIADFTDADEARLRGVSVTDDLRRLIVALGSSTTLAEARVVLVAIPSTNGRS